MRLTPAAAVSLLLPLLPVAALAGEQPGGGAAEPVPRFEPASKGANPWDQVWTAIDGMFKALSAGENQLRSCVEQKKGALTVPLKLPEPPAPPEKPRTPKEKAEEATRICRETATIETIARAKSGKLRLRAVLCLAVARQDRSLCDKLNVGETSAKIVSVCRERYDALRLSGALVRRQPDAAKVCRESPAEQDDELGRLPHPDACAALAQGDVKGACATTARTNTGAKLRGAEFERACSVRLEAARGSGVCDQIEDPGSVDRELCAQVGILRQAGGASAGCGAASFCGAMAGLGDKACAPVLAQAAVDACPPRPVEADYEAEEQRQYAALVAAHQKKLEQYKKDKDAAMVTARRLEIERVEQICQKIVSEERRLLDEIFKLMEGVQPRSDPRLKTYQAKLQAAGLRHEKLRQALGAVRKP